MQAKLSTPPLPTPRLLSMCNNEEVNLTNNTSKIREILALRACGWSISTLSIVYEKDRSSIRHHLNKYDIQPLTQVIQITVPKRPAPPPPPSKTPQAKYQHLFDEPINQGHSYREYVERAKKRHPTEQWHQAPVGKQKPSDIFVEICL